MQERSAAATSSPSPAYGRWARPTVVALVAVALHLQTVRYDFVYDDFLVVLKNPWLRSFRYLGEVFTSSVSGFTDPTLIPNYYRPLIYAYYMVAYKLSGTSPAGYHLLSVLAHALVAVAVYLLAQALAGDEAPLERRGFLTAPLLAGVVFAVHPIHTEAVAFIGACTELLFALCYLLAFWLYVTAPRVRSWRYALSVACYLASALFKEPGVTLPLLLVLYDAAAQREGFWRRLVPRQAAFALAFAAYFVLRLNALGAMVPYQRHGELGLAAHLLNAGALFGEYVYKVVVPTGMTIFHTFTPATSLADARVAGGLFAVAALMALGWWARRQPVVLVALALFVVPLLPALYVSGVGESAFADRYLYVPSAAFAILLAWAVRRAAVGSGGAARAALAGVASLTAVYAVGTVVRNEVWRDDLSLWSDALEKAPGHPVPLRAIGDYYVRKNDVDRAIPLFERAVEARPDDTGLLDALGIALAQRGDDAAAERVFRQAIAAAPDDPRQQHNLGLVLARQKRYDEAIAAFTAALRVRPDYARAAAELRATRQEQLNSARR